MPQTAILVDDETGDILNVGMTALTFRGETVVIDGLMPYQGMNGKVKCIDSDGNDNYWYSSVIGAHFVYNDII
jgi:hypothetical protein